MHRIKYLFISAFFLEFLCLAFLIPNTFGNELNIGRREYDFAEDSKDESPMNSKYLSGLYLIYDCPNHYFACVDRESFESCKELREKNIKFTKAKRQPCAPFKKFETRVDCLKEQYRLIQRGGNLSLCNFQNNQ